MSSLIEAAGMPKPRRQHRLVGSDGRPVARFDLALPEARIAFEFESYRHHFGRQAWRRDIGRNNGAAAEGWIVFRADRLTRTAAAQPGGGWRRLGGTARLR